LYQIKAIADAKAKPMPQINQPQLPKLRQMLMQSETSCQHKAKTDADAKLAAATKSKQI
jgi:hypothetical protein